MVRTFLISAIAMAVLCGTAFGQQQNEKGAKVGQVAPDIEAKDWILAAPGDEVPSLVRLRGLVVVLVFWVSWHDGAEVLLPYVNMYANNPRVGTTGGIFTIGVTDADYATTEPLVRKKQLFFPVATGVKKAAEDYGFDSNWGVVVIDTEGKIAYKGQPQDMDAWLSQVVDQLKKSPPWRTHPTEARKVVRLLGDARDAIKGEKYATAATAAKEALERSVSGDRLRSEAMAMIDLLDLIGYERLSKVNAAVDAEEYVRAAEICRQVERRFRGLDVYLDAKRRAEALSKENDKFKLQWDQYTDESKAFAMYTDAREAVKQKRVGEAWELLSRIVNNYPNTEMAEHAQQMIDRMMKDPVVWGHVTDFQAKGARDFLAQAKNLKDAGRCKEAKALYERVMKEYNNSIYAEEAKNEIAKLPC
ncbi:MAG: hypothetical protein HZB38_05015 [Planctomycetes bacterium]|nr:hypothetical protein [Planctomycetota bacterium]